MNHKNILNTYGCKRTISYMVYYYSANFWYDIFDGFQLDKKLRQNSFYKKVLQLLQMHGEKFWPSIETLYITLK